MKTVPIVIPAPAAQSVFPAQAVRSVTPAKVFQSVISTQAIWNVIPAKAGIHNGNLLCLYFAFAKAGNPLYRSDRRLRKVHEQKN